jgi:hypothetical protein
MKKYFLFLILLITISCEEDLPNQLTSVEGIVSDYYSKQPVPEIPIVVTEFRYFDFFNEDLKILDTIYSNPDGYYYFDFYNIKDRNYTIEILPTEFYFSGYLKTITEGKKNSINLLIKPFRKLTLNCYNQSNTDDRLYIFSYLNRSEFKCTQCEELTIVDFKIVPEQENKFSIEVYKENKKDTIRSKFLRFFAGINDTTFNYYY